MIELGPGQAAPSTDELIQQCGGKLSDLLKQELSDESDPDRVYILRKVFKSYLYFRDLQNFAPALFQSIVNLTGLANQFPNAAFDDDGGLYDYSQNIYRGYCRKLEAVLGNRMPNAIAVPDNSEDEDAIRATRSANTAAMYIRQRCELEVKNLDLVHGLFNYGTMFWHIDWVIDGEKNGYDQPSVTQAVQQPLGDASFNCPQCAQSHPADPANPAPPEQCAGCGGSMGPESYQPPTMADLPQETPGAPVAKGGLEITLHDSSEITVPLTARTVDGDMMRLRYEREWHKAKCLKKWPKLADESSNASTNDDTSIQIYAQSIRSAMASPIGLIRTKRMNEWTVCDDWIVPEYFELIEDKTIKALLQQNFKTGLRITTVRGTVVDLQDEKLSEHWQECKPEPSTRIMGDPLGDDWAQTQDITNNLLNQRNEVIERSNEPGYADPRYLDFEAYQLRKDDPTELIPVIRPAGGNLSDVLYRPDANRFSDQIGPFRQEIEETAKNVSGELDAIWGGGDSEEPTARQAELKKNAALMQLGIIWTQMRKSLEKVYFKACRLLAEYEQGVIAFSKKNQFGRYSSLPIVIDDLRNGKYHFEADEAIPMTWGQMRDLLMWMLDKPAPLLEMWGMNDPLNIFEFKQLVGMPGERTPLLDDRERAMDTIGKLLQAAPTPGQPNPDGSTGDPQPSIQPTWEENNDFCAKIAKAYLVVNSTLADENPNGYQNVVLWGKAQEQLANQAATPPKPEPKTSVAVSLKGGDLGSPAVQSLLNNENLLPQGVQVQSDADKMAQMQMQMPPPGGMPPPGSAPPAPPQAPPPPPQ